jgi:hypothetical protein
MPVQHTRLPRDIRRVVAQEIADVELVPQRLVRASGTVSSRSSASASSWRDFSSECASGPRAAEHRQRAR